MAFDLVIPLSAQQVGKRFRMRPPEGSSYRPGMSFVGSAEDTDGEYDVLVTIEDADDGWITGSFIGER